MPTNAPSPNCGFTVTEKAGWVRLWLANDNPGGPGRDLWAVPGRFYPLAVAAYEFVETEHPEALAFDERADLGGYTHSLGLDELPYPSLPSNVGFYVGSTAGGSIEVTDGGGPHDVTLAPGDFYAGNVMAVGSSDTITYLFLVIP